MKTFVKILLLAALVVIAIKLSPLFFVALMAGLLAAVVLGSVGLSIVAVLVAILLGLAVALAPIWIPVLLIIGLINLFRSNRSAPPVPPVAA
ncbi:MAG: hypothetical protein Q8M02_15995 [Candidatus Didemnitutus sp.]|nr:hypothetical protein [Candidatus Didemnitutus sp.]